MSSVYLTSVLFNDENRNEPYVNVMAADLIPTLNKLALSECNPQGIDSETGNQAHISITGTWERVVRGMRALWRRKFSSGDMIQHHREDGIEIDS